MRRALGTIVVCAGTLLGLSSPASAQTATYHLHKENSSTGGLFQLKVAGPDGSSLAITSADLRNQPVGEYLVKAFDTQAGVPGVAGTIPSGSSLSFTIWMRKTANFGVMQPRVRVRKNTAGGTLLCEATGASNLTTTVTSYALSCNTSANISYTTSDRFYLWVGVNVTTAPGNNTVRGQSTSRGHSTATTTRG